MPRLSVVVPVFREAEGIRRFHAELGSVLRLLPSAWSAEILFVMDPSDDGTLDQLQEISAIDERVTVIVMTARFGHQMALIAGMDHTDADACVMMDADLQHPPSLLPVLVAKYEAGYDVVITVRQDPRRSNIAKRFASRAFYAGLNRLTDVDIPSGGADFRLLSRRVVDVFRFQLRERNQFLRGLVSWVGFRRTVVPYQTQPRAGGRSKYSLTRSVAFAAQGIVSSTKKPLTASIGMGLVVAALGFCYALWSVIVFFVDRQLPSGYTSLVILFATLGGIQLIFLGVLGLYVGAVFEEAKGRPHYLIDQVIGRRADAISAALERRTGETRVTANGDDRPSERSA